MRPYLITLLLLAALSAQASALENDQTLNVVVSIKPLYSLVTGIMQGVAQPQLLMSTNQPIHHYSLKPSERRALSKAELIFWIGPSLESFMPRLLNSLDSKTQVVSLLETKNLILHPVRQSHHHNNQHAQVDPHIWLNTKNLEVMINEITQQLIRIDPAHTTQYNNNKQRLSSKIIKLRQTLQQKLKGSYQPFITHHDSYQYFEKEFNLNNLGFVSNSIDAQPSARHLQELRQTINKKTIHCVFYNAPYEPPIINSLLHGSDVQKIELDPTGINTAAGEDSIFATLTTLGSAFSDCLSLKKHSSQ